MDEPITVVLADDHPAVRAGIRAALGEEPDILVIAEAGTREEARSRSLALRPAVLILDLSMPGPPLLNVVADLRAQLPEMQIVVLTAHDAAAQARDLLGLGVSGYVLKDEPLDAVVRAVRTVAHGETHVSRAILSKVLPGSAVEQVDARAEATLTARERQLLRLLMEGWEMTRIANTVGISEQAVRNYLSRLYGKIGMHSRAEATAWAHRHGIGNN